MHAEHPPQVLAVRAGLAPEARRVPGVSDRQLRLVEDLSHVQRGERHLRCADEVELVLVGPVDVHLVGRQEPGAEHRLLAHEHGRDDRCEPPVRERVHRVTHQGELHEDDVAEQIDEARPARASAPIDVEHPEELPQRDVVPRLEVESVLETFADMDAERHGADIHGRGADRHFGGIAHTNLRRLALLSIRG